MDRRTRLAKEHAIATLEHAALSLVTAITLKGDSSSEKFDSAVNVPKEADASDGR